MEAIEIDVVQDQTAGEVDELEEWGGCVWQGEGVIVMNRTAIWSRGRCVGGRGRRVGPYRGHSCGGAYC